MSPRHLLAAAVLLAVLGWATGCPVSDRAIDKGYSDSASKEDWNKAATHRKDAARRHHWAGGLTSPLPALSSSQTVPLGLRRAALSDSASGAPVGPDDRGAADNAGHGSLLPPRPKRAGKERRSRSRRPARTLTMEQR